MRQRTRFNIILVFTSAALFFAVPFGSVLALVGLYGLTHLAITRDGGNTSAALRSLGTSTRFGWFSHGLHTVIAVLLGYRLAKKAQDQAIPTIWMAVALAMSVHMGIHRLAGVSAHDLHTKFQYIRLPFMMLFGAFVGFHSYFLQ